MTQWGLDTLFNPAKRHMDDEKRRLQSTREEAGDSSGGKRIDLASGKVVIRREDGDETEGTKVTQSADGTAETSSPPGSGASVRGKPAAGKKPGVKAASSEPSPAAVRAAKRRGRSI